MIRVFHHAGGDGPPRQVAFEQLDTYAAAEGWVWIDVRDEPAATLQALGERFELSPYAVEDAGADLHFPKVDDFGDHLFVVLHGLTQRDDRLETGELDVFLGERFLVTVHHGESPSIDWVLTQEAAFAPTPDLMFARLAETSARRFLPLLETIDAEIDDLEERAVAGDGAVIGEIQALRRDVVRVRRAIGPQREVLANLSRPFSPLVGDRARLRFASVYDHHFRLAEGLDSARSLLAATLDTYRGAVAERMNDVMKVLTVYAAILLPLTVIAGVYGMNFDNMPELKWRLGYFALLGLMASIAIGQWIYFARRGFIGAFKFARVPRALGRGLVRLAQLPVDAVASLVAPLGVGGPGDDEAD